MPSNGQRRVANDRERKRTENLNKAFRQLQSIIPKEPSDKMSKINTLKLTLDYIQFLNDILNDEDDKACKEVARLTSGSLETTDGHGSDSSSTSPCGSSYYAPNQSTSPIDRTDYEDDFQHRAKKRRPTIEPLQLSAQPAAAATLSTTPIVHHQLQPQTPTSDLPISPTCTSYHSFASYYTGDQQYSSCSPTTKNTNFDGIYSGQQNVFTPQQANCAYSSPKQQDTSLLLRSAFRKYRMTRRKR